MNDHGHSQPDPKDKSGVLLVEGARIESDDAPGMQHEPKTFNRPLSEQPSELVPREISSKKQAA